MSSTDSILRKLRREVWIVTASAGGKRGGLSATWVNAASIDPERPVMLAGIAPNHFTAELIASSRAFGLHLLRKDQVELAWSFACDSGRDRDKLAGLATTTSVSGSPLLTDVLAWLDCRVVAQYHAGDRIFFWGDVIASHQATNELPLADCDFIAALAPEQREHLLRDREKDVQIQRPLHDAWRLKSSGE